MELREFWGLAEVHCQSFYPRAGWPFASFLRLDRVVAMQASAYSSLDACRMTLYVSSRAVRVRAVLLWCLPKQARAVLLCALRASAPCSATVSRF